MAAKMSSTSLIAEMAGVPYKITATCSCEPFAGVISMREDQNAHQQLTAEMAAKGIGCHLFREYYKFGRFTYRFQMMTTAERA